MQSYVYFIQSGLDNKIKIGTTKHLQDRIRSIECMHGNPVKLLGILEGNVRLEKALHEVFKPFRRMGEWFEPSEVILDYIELMTTSEIPTDDESIPSDACLMTWDASKRGWRKMFRGKVYTVSCYRLGCPDNKIQSAKAANEWWRKKKRTISMEV